MAPMRLLVDARSEGAHGIARYSTEILARLHVPHTPVYGRLPSLPFDSLTLFRARLSKEDILYSPSYVCTPSRSKQLITLHDLIHLNDTVDSMVKYESYYRRVVKPIVRKAGHVFTVSDSSAAQIREWLDDDHVSIHNTGNGCSEAFNKCVEPWRQPKPYILMVTNAKAHKNVDVVLKAARMLPQLELVIVSSDRSALETRAALLGVVNSRVLGGLTDRELASYYAGAAALAFPSLEEGFGLPIVEATHVGCPVIWWSGCTASREVCGKAGYAVQSSSDPGEWASAFTFAVDGGNIARPDVSQYTWDAVAKRVNKVLSIVTDECRN